MLDFMVVATISECTHLEHTYEMVDTPSGTVIYRSLFPHGKVFPRPKEVYTDLGMFESTQKLGSDTKVFTNKSQARDALCNLLLTKGE